MVNVRRFLRVMFSVVAFGLVVDGFQQCDPAFYWIWRIVFAVVMALLAIAWSIKED